MSVVETLKSVVGLSDGRVTTRYRCIDCDNEFESAKDPDRAKCMECLGTNVEPVEGG
jgi:hypothetical protein